MSYCFHFNEPCMRFFSIGVHFVYKTQRTLTVGGSITVQLISSLTSVKLTNEGTIILFEFSEAV